MIKSELIARMASKLPHLSEKDVALSVNELIEHMSEVLGGGGRIEIRGFGSFCLHYRPPRNAHNPKTGEKVITVEKYSPHFKPGKELRELVDASAQGGSSQGGAVSSMGQSSYSDFSDYSSRDED